MKSPKSDKTPPSDSVRRVARRCLCFVSPRWALIQQGPLTTHLMLSETKVGEQEARYEIEENRCGDKRCWVTEPGGWRYKIDPSRLYQLNDRIHTPTPKKKKP